MPNGSFLMMVDHDNVPYEKVSISDLLEAWLKVLPGQKLGIVSIRVRAYGGWFAGSSITEDRFKASEFYQANAPAIFKRDGTYCRLSFEFADGLACLKSRDFPEGVKITHTVVKRPAAQTVSLVDQAPQCDDPECGISAVKVWISRRRACMKKGCSRNFTDFFRRVEQKQVDVHMAVDLLLCAQAGFDELAIVSDDADLLPAVLAASAYKSCDVGLSMIKFNRAPTYLDACLLSQGVRILHASDAKE